MGMLEISVRGSFPTIGNMRVFQFSAEDGGHADAVSRAITTLARDLLPEAIKIDHKLHAANEEPKRAFGTGVAEGAEK